MRRTVLAVSLTAIVVAVLATVAHAQSTQMARGTISAITGDTVTVATADRPMTFTVDAKTVVTQRGLARRRGRLRRRAKPGPKLSELLKVGEPVEVSYRDMGGKLQAASIRRTPLGGRRRQRCAEGRDRQRHRRSGEPVVTDDHGSRHERQYLPSRRSPSTARRASSAMASAPPQTRRVAKSLRPTWWRSATASACRTTTWALTSTPRKSASRRKSNSRRSVLASTRGRVRRLPARPSPRSPVSTVSHSCGRFLVRSGSRTRAR